MSNMGVNVIDGRLRMSPELSAQLGIPDGMEFWRYNLIYAARSMDGYAAAMRNMGNADLHYLLTLYDQLEGIARRNPGLILPIALDADLHALLDDVRRNVRAEAAKRGVTLMSWSETQN